MGFAPDGRAIPRDAEGQLVLWEFEADSTSQVAPRIVHGERGREIHWDLGTLQYSSTVNGPWTDLPAASPFLLSPIGDKGFFRVKVDG